MRHRASYFFAFFAWLVKQEGFGCLNQTLPDHFELPKGAVAPPAPQDARAFPTVMEVREMLSGLPVETRIQRRDRAMVATAFAGALRASALVSLRVEHFDVEAESIFHDGTRTRAKNGKSFVVKAFPRQEAALTILAEWRSEMTTLGLRAGDALFPPQSALAAESREDIGTASVEPMASGEALSRVFTAASSVVGKAFTPHSTRHHLAALGRSLCRTAEQWHAWTRNMGHEREDTIERNYGKMPDHDRFMVLGALGLSEVLCEEETSFVLDLYEHRLLYGSPEWTEAKREADLRSQRRGPDPRCQRRQDLKTLQRFRGAKASCTTAMFLVGFSYCTVHRTANED